jgi:hypothetical protein
MSKAKLEQLLNNELSPEKVKDMAVFSLYTFLIDEGIVASAEDFKMLVIEAVQNAAVEDDEFPIHFYSKDEPMPEESRTVEDPGPMLTDDYIKSSFQND